MSEEIQSPFRVLFVDDDRAFLDTIREAFETFSKGSWHILTTPDAGSVAALLKQEPVDLIVLDMRMPEISGLQLMGILQREHGSVPKVFLSGASEESERVAALEGGAELFLEKPVDPGGLQSIYATLDELLKWRRKQKSGAEPSRAQLLDLVKLECKSGNSRLFEVTTGETRGSIYVKEGAIIHSECPGRRGQSAFTFLTTRLDAEFRLRQYQEPTERSIIRQWEFLYLEAVQVREQFLQAAADAKAREAAQALAATTAAAVAAAAPPVVTEAPASATAPQSAPAAAPPPAPTPTASPATPPPAGGPPPAAAPTTTAPATSRAGDEDVTQVFLRHRGVTGNQPGAAAPAAPPPPTESVPAPPAAPTPAEIRRPAPSPEPLPTLRMVSTGPVAEEVGGATAAATGTPTVVAGPPIEEVLVCSNAHEALYDWQCADLEGRLRLVELARERSERISQHLPVGGIDRVELQAPTGRMIIQFQEDGSILVRTSSGVEQGEIKGSVFHQSVAGWLARHSTIRGLLAAGVIRPPQASINHSSSRDFPREPLSVAWRCVQDLFEACAAFNPWQLRWVHEKAQLYVSRRTDGKALAMFLERDPEQLDTAAVERVFSDFKILEAG